VSPGAGRRHRHSHHGQHRVRLAVLGVAAVAGGGLTAYALMHGSHGSASGTGANHKSITIVTAVPKAVPTTVPPAVTIAAVGDLDLGNTPNLPPDPVAYLQPVVAALAAPVVFGNLEGTLTDGTASKCGASSTNCYAFRNPPAYAAALKSSGFTVLNSANNHSHDFGTQGVADTTTALQAAGLIQSGLPGQIGLQRVGSTTVAFVDFAPYGNTNNLLDPTAIKALITRARSEATVVVVYLHVGAEGTAAAHVTGRDETYVGEDRGNSLAVAHGAVDDGASLVIASGPHVLRGIEEYKGHVIDYSLGNFAGFGNFSTIGAMDLSAILTVTMSQAGVFVSGRFTSLAMTSEGRPSVDPTGASATFVNQLSTADFGPAAVLVQPSGQLALPTPPA
jgi:hypothetical protein